MILEEKTIKWDNFKWLYKYLDLNEDVNLVSNYLKDNNLVIKLKGCYDSQSGWSGENVILEGKDLSGNGYCFDGDKLLNHVKLFKKYKDTSMTEEYNTFLQLLEKYKDVYEYLKA